MAEEEYTKKLGELQQYIPFLENMITQLRDPKKKNREAQLSKMESLHSMITDKKRKLRIDTLQKCEEVIKKLYDKVKPRQQTDRQPDLTKFICKDPPDKISEKMNAVDDIMNTLKLKAARARLNEIATPASPSPPRETQKLHVPIVIPVEKKRITNRDDLYIGSWESTISPQKNVKKSVTKEFTYKHDKPDVYSQVNVSEGTIAKKSVFDRLGHRSSPYCWTKPVLSDADLQSLTASPESSIPPDAEKLSMTQLQDLRVQLRFNLKMTPSSSPEKVDKLPQKTPQVVPPQPVLSQVCVKPKSPRAEVVFKNPDSKFGNLLSSIDDQIFGEIKEKLKEPVKKDDKKDPTKKDSAKKDEKGKKDVPKKDEKHRDDSKKLDSVEKILKDHKSESGKGEKKHKHSKKDKKSHTDTKSHKKDKDSHKHKSSSGNSKSKHKSHHTDDKPKTEIETSPKDVPETEDRLPSPVEIVKPSSFKRIADKYNPKPRKPSIEIEIDPKVSETIEKNIALQTGPKLSFFGEMEHSIGKKIGTVINKTVDLGPKIPFLNEPEPFCIGQRIDTVVSQKVECSPRPFFEPPPSQKIDTINTRGALLPTPPDMFHNSCKPDWMGQNNFEPVRRNVLDPRLSAFDNINQLKNIVAANTLLQNSNLIGSMTPKDPFLSPNQNLLDNQRTNAFGQPFAPNNPIVARNQIYPMQQQHNQYGVPHQINMMNQNIGNAGNTYVNTFVLQHNQGQFGTNQGQFGNNQSNYSNQFSANKSFRPFDPIESTNRDEYDLSKMQPVDFYSSNQNLAKPSLISPPIQGRSSYSTPFGQRDRLRIEPPPPKPELKDEERANQNYEQRLSSKDPRLKAREDRSRDYKPANSRPKCNHPPRRQSIDDHRHNRYDDMYKNLDRKKETEKFASPLESLYTSGVAAKTAGKGYGFQNFKIPKRRKADKEEFPEKKTELVEVKKPSKPELKSDIDEPKKMKEPKKLEEPVKEVIEECVKVDVEEPVVEEPEKAAEPVETAVDVVSSSTSVAEAVTSTSSETPPPVVESAKASPTEQSMLTDFITNLVTNSNKKDLLLALFNTLADGMGEQHKKKFKRIQKCVDSDSSSEEEPSTTAPKIKSIDPDSAVEKLTEDIEEDAKAAVVSEVEKVESINEKEPAEIVAKAPVQRKKKMKRKFIKKVVKKPQFVKRKKGRAKANFARGTKIEETPMKIPEETNSVVESVGERIKNRRRQSKASPPKSRKCRTELDMLHEDIKEMFICDGILTATGKRMCRLLKDEPSALDSTEQEVKRADSDDERPLTARKQPAKKDTTKQLESPKRRAKAANLRVIIEKTDLKKLAKGEHPSSDEEFEEEQERPKSRAAKNKSTESPKKVGLIRTARLQRNSTSKIVYTERDSDEEAPPPLKLEAELPESSPEDDISLKDLAKRKKKKSKNWALGVIKKPKKKVKGKAETSSTPVSPLPSDEEEEELPNLERKIEPEPIVAKKDEKSSDSLYIHPDLQYFFEPKEVIECKICAFKGKMIVQHYKTIHPAYEVLISRFSPDTAEAAIKESEKNNYESVEAVDVMDGKTRKRKFNYQCRFCKAYFKNETSETFFDHITSHTGEYRFPCTACSFKTSNCKSLRSHIYTSHNLRSEAYGSVQAAYLPPPNFHLVFGYLCSMCNFTQLSKDAIEDHRKIYHLGDNKIYKINMSAIVSKILPSKAPEVPETSVVEPASKEEKQLQTDVAKVVDKATPADEDVPEQKKDLPETNVNTLEAPTIKLEVPDEVPLPKAAPVVEAAPVAEAVPSVAKTALSAVEAASSVVEPPPREEEQNVFTCNPSVIEQDKKIEEERLQRMKQINETINPKRSFLSFTEKLKSRLEKHSSEVSKDTVSAADTSVTPEETAAAPEAPVSVAAPQVTENLVPAEAIKPTSVCKPKVVAEDSIALSKNNDPISSTIQKLQDKLMSEMNQKLPALVPIFSMLPSASTNAALKEVIIRVGPVEARNQKTHIAYNCYVECCVFGTTSPVEFRMHCENAHTGFDWDGKCEICGKVMDTFNNRLSIIMAYQHLHSVHNNLLQLDIPKVRVRRLSELSGSVSDVQENRTDSPASFTGGETAGKNGASRKDRSISEDGIPDTDNSLTIDLSGNADEMPEDSVQSENVAGKPWENTFKIINIVSETPMQEANHEFPFTISSVTTLTPEQEQALDIIPTSSMVVSPPALSPILKCKPATVISPLPMISSLKPINNSSLYCIPGGFAGFSGGTALQQAVPPQSSPSKLTILRPSRKSRTQLTLKDTLMKPDEAKLPRKTPFVLAQMLRPDKLAHLYKCPHRKCKYSTDSKGYFESHLHHTHTDLQNNSLVPCLYCNYKTEFSFIVIHIDIRHGPCEYTCIYCFYRSICQSYVEIHQAAEHPEHPVKVLKVPINPDSTTTKGTLSLVDMKKIILPYVCAQTCKGTTRCNTTFLFTFAFKYHLHSAHNGQQYRCGYCDYSTGSSSLLVEHMHVHGIFCFHCRYCMYGGLTMADVYKHQALQHNGIVPDIVTREFIPDSSEKSYLDYNSSKDETFARLKRIRGEDIKFVTPNALVCLPLMKKQQLSLLNRKSGAPEPAAKDNSETVTKSALENQIILISTPQGSRTPYRVLEVMKNPPKLSSLKEAPTVLNSMVSLATSKPKESVSEIGLQPKAFTFKNVEKGDTDASTRSFSPIILNKLLTLPTYVDPLVDLQKDDDDVANEPSNEVDPLQLDSEPCPVSSALEASDPTVPPTFTEARLDIANFGFTDDGDSQDFSDLVDSIMQVGEDTTKKQDLHSYDLFKCINCKIGFENSPTFKTHLVKCILLTSGIPRPFKCAHCTKSFKNPTSLVDHVRIHGTSQISCSLCDYKHQNQFHVRNHMKTVHKITSVSIVAVNPLKTDFDKDEFIVRPKFSKQKSATDVTSAMGKDTSISEDAVAVKTSYSPEEMNLLPRQAIYSKELKCSVCSYTSKVRTNLVRHFLFHSSEKDVPDSAPVNPVPCLEKNEKMFDKMTNLALSSLANTPRMGGKVEKSDRKRLSVEEESKLPIFVACTKRYVCGVTNCNYLCLEESMLRHHLLALHSSDTLYKCAHCNSELVYDNGGINVDHISKHLKLHGLHLYKCAYCDFLHYLRVKVERHNAETHSDKPSGLVIVREMENEPEDAMPLPEKDEVKSVKLWRCGMCKFRSAIVDDMKSHAFNKHNMSSQYKCALCSYKNSDKHFFESHFLERHPDQKIDVIDVFYKVDDGSGKNRSDLEPFDTTPLWLRDRPRVRHIRGILFDDDGHSPKKSSPVKNMSVDHLERAIDAVASGVGEPSTQRRLKATKDRDWETDIVDVVGIDDDVVEISPDSASNSSSDGNTKSKASGSTNKTLDDSVIHNLIERAKAVEETDLIERYGPYGNPYNNKQYLCPLCNKFKTKKVEDITNHMYRELQYSRYVCTNCGLTGITYEYLHRHSLKKHREGRPESIVPLSPDPNIQSWVLKVLEVQRNLMSSAVNPNPSVVTNESVEIQNVMLVPDNDGASVKEVDPLSRLGNFRPDNKFPCTHCPYTTRYLGDLRKHMKRHWEQKPLQCGYCTFTAVTNSEVIQHSKRAHQDKEPNIITIPIESPKIKPISRKRKSIAAFDSPSASGRPSAPIKISKKVSNAPETIVIGEDESPTEVNEQDIYVCQYCPKRCINEQEMKCHWEKMHTKKNYEFKFKKMKLSQAKIGKGCQYLKCGHCTNYVASYDMLQKHHAMAHPRSTFFAFRHMCGQCSRVFMKLAPLKIHFRKTHVGVALMYTTINETNIANDPLGTKIDGVYRCCNLSFEEPHQLQTHHENNHTDKQTTNPPRIVTSPTDSENRNFKCKLCQYDADTYIMILEHVKYHFKPYECLHCSATFGYPSLIKHHYSQKHPEKELNYRTLDEGMCKLSVRNNILELSQNGVYEISKQGIKRGHTSRVLNSMVQIIQKQKIATGPSLSKRPVNVARKSTTQSLATASNITGFSYYRCKPDISGLENVFIMMTGPMAAFRMNLQQMRQLVNIDPVVPLVDYAKELEDIP